MEGERKEVIGDKSEGHPSKADHAGPTGPH